MCCIERGSRVTKDDILETFKDINYYYNDCGKYETLSYMLDKFLEEQMTFRRQMFNRCAAQTHCETCEICIWFEQCEKERTLNPL